MTPNDVVTPQASGSMMPDARAPNSWGPGPWLDRMSLGALTRLYMPLSRLWAAAIEADGSPEAFASALDLPHPPRAATTLAALRAAATRRHDWERAEAAWRAALFGAEAPRPATLFAAERRRVQTAEALMAVRTRLFAFQLLRPAPAVRWAVASPEETTGRHGARLADPARAFDPLDPALVTRSHGVELGRERRTTWLRWPATAAGRAETGWARVVEPREASDPPTIVALHGIAVESEFWGGGAAADGFVAAGFRVIRPEAPFHGRRRLPGFYGGEPILARGPLGLMDTFEAAVAEIGMLVAWARATGSGPVAVSGVSLGALTAQLVVANAGAWPAACRPDAALLVATTGDIAGLAADGALGRSIGAGARLRAAGWAPEAMQPWAPLVQPLGAPAIAPDRVVMVLGSRDEVTPFEGGLALARKWGIPPENLFVRPYGHFTLALAAGPQSSALARLAAVLSRR